ncbi:MAG: FAD-dependent thymidylate synthase [Ignavibacteriales bacterium]|nr:FAD-dependent thymidylate synthase [Ignavibacteriales bacterium]
MLKQGHGSVFEHANYVLLLEGISRSCTHELVRHRAGFAYSQLSQRYVDESEANFVMPPGDQGDAAMEGEWEAAGDGRAARLRGGGGPADGEVPLGGERTSTAGRWRARRRAASCPTATETKIVVTANVRAWRTMLELRLGEGAELEIRRLAVAVLRVLQAEAPALFADFELYARRPMAPKAEAGADTTKCEIEVPANVVCRPRPLLLSSLYRFARSRGNLLLCRRALVRLDSRDGLFCRGPGWQFG